MTDFIVERRQDLEKLKAEIVKLESGPLDAKEAKALARKRKKVAEWDAFLASPPWPRFPELPDDIRERLIGEREELRFYISSHPLNHVQLPKSETTAHVREGRAGGWLSVSGVVSDADVATSRRGSLWARFTLEDLEGTCPAIAFGDVARDVVDGAVVTVRGVVETRDESPVLKVTNMKTLERW
ncbi:OB-fold nucleic acid binding domain-containing protein [Jiangella anatolica]|uniref:OB-fold nucleic acid binding domain-containing protein n=1 Tax=Jiangella anatolica TaxID=2670374 RepID=UPI0011B75040|nr:OB-fold nucleic acid binding domain-containing protein [Jiangella anatolica]